MSPFTRLKMGEQKNVPLKDRQMALALILELALQRGTLQQILEAVLLLLRLSGSTCRYYHSNQVQLKCKGEETLKKPPEYAKGPPECGQSSDHCTHTHSMSPAQNQGNSQREGGYTVM